MADEGQQGATRQGRMLQRMLLGVLSGCKVVQGAALTWSHVAARVGKQACRAGGTAPAAG